jgi:hypothetical protein
VGGNFKKDSRLKTQGGRFLPVARTTLLRRGIYYSQRCCEQKMVEVMGIGATTLSLRYLDPTIEVIVARIRFGNLSAIDRSA